MKMPVPVCPGLFQPDIFRVPLWGLAVIAVAGLTGCASAGSAQALQILSARGGRVDLLQDTLSPVLVVQSAEGIGHARLKITRPLPEGMTFEFPGLKKLEHFSLSQSGRALVCAGTDEIEAVCSWGREWPVAHMKRYPGGMTVTVPEKVFALPGEWTLEWVNYYRN